MNDWQKSRFTKNIVSTLFNTVTGKRIALLGWAFKKDTNDTRESAAIYVCRDLLLEEATVAVYDPKVDPEQMKRDLLYAGLPENLLDNLEVCDSATAATNQAHGTAILTEWDEFMTLDWEAIYEGMFKPAFLFDGRNVIDLKKLRTVGFHVYAIGKG